MWLDTVCINLDARHLILRWGSLNPLLGIKVLFGDCTASTTSTSR